MALRMATSEATCEYVCPETRPLVTDQLEELRSKRWKHLYSMFS